MPAMGFGGKGERKMIFPLFVCIQRMNMKGKENLMGKMMRIMKRTMKNKILMTSTVKEIVKKTTMREISTILPIALAGEG